jgi:hypothetical protein
LRDHCILIYLSSKVSNTPFHWMIPFHHWCKHRSSTCHRKIYFLV